MLKKEHEGKRVNDGNSFDTDTYVYEAHEGTVRNKRNRSVLTIGGSLAGGIDTCGSSS